MKFKRLISATLIATGLLAVALFALMSWLWRDRPSLDGVDWPQPVAAAGPDDVTLTAKRRF